MNLIRLLIATLRNWHVVRLLFSAGNGIRTTISAVVALVSAVALIFGGNFVAGVPALVVALKALFVIFGGLAIFLLQATISALQAMIGEAQRDVAHQKALLLIHNQQIADNRNAMALQHEELIAQKSYVMKSFASQDEKLKAMANPPAPKPQPASNPNPASQNK